MSTPGAPLGPLDKDLPLPLYYQLKCAVRDAIDLGYWQAGEQLPNENKLAEDFGVSKITVRQALRQLADLGYVRREQGRGTFVSKPKLEQGPRDLTGFTEEMRRRRVTATSRVLEHSEAPADARVAEALELCPGEPVFVLKRLRMADGEPMGIQTAHVPAGLAPGLVGENFEHASLYEVLQTRYGLQAARARESHFAALAEPVAAELLGIACGSPVLAAERVTFLSTGKPLEYVESVMRGDRYSIVLDLVGNRAPQASREGATR
jgi:GntR family transcriptional regulator